MHEPIQALIIPLVYGLMHTASRNNSALARTTLAIRNMHSQSSRSQSSTNCWRPIYKTSATSRWRRPRCMVSRRHHLTRATHNALSPVPSLYTGVVSLSNSSCGLLSTSWSILRFAALSTPFSLRIVNPGPDSHHRRDSREVRNVVFFVEVVDLAVPKPCQRLLAALAHRESRPTYPLDRTALFSGISP